MNCNFWHSHNHLPCILSASEKRKLLIYLFSQSTLNAYKKHWRWKQDKTYLYKSCCDSKDSCCSHHLVTHIFPWIQNPNYWVLSKTFNFGTKWKSAREMTVNRDMGSVHTIQTFTECSRVPKDFPKLNLFSSMISSTNMKQNWKMSGSNVPWQLQPKRSWRWMLKTWRARLTLLTKVGKKPSNNFVNYRYVSPKLQVFLLLCLTQPQYKS